MFYFRKKTGIPKLRDSGIADILLGGSGITSTIRLQSAPRDSGSLFFVRSVHVKVDALKFSIRDSQHDVLYKFLRPIAVVIVKREVQRALTKSIKNAFETIDQLLVKVRDRMDEAKLREGETRAGALKDVSEFLHCLLCVYTFLSLVHHETETRDAREKSETRRTRTFQYFTEKSIYFFVSAGQCCTDRVLLLELASPSQHW